MQTTIIRNLSQSIAYTLPQQYTTVLPGNITVSGNANESTILLTCLSGVDYLISILYRSNTGVAFPKVHIALIDGVNIELVSIGTYSVLNNTKLHVNIGKTLEFTYEDIDLKTIQIDAQYSNIQISGNNITADFSFLDKAKAANVPITNFSLPNMAAGGLPMIIVPSDNTAAVITGGGGDRTSKDPNLPALKLTWNDIVNAIHTTVGDYNSNLGTDFTTLTVDGNDQYLSGNSTAVALNSIFSSNTNIVGVEDAVSSISSLENGALIGCTALTSVSLPECTTLGSSALKICTALTSVSLPACTTLGDGALQGCTSLTSLSLPLCETVGDEALYGCTSLIGVSLPLCEDLGGSVGDDGVFDGIASQTITLTIASSRETCNGGNPDGDIVYLSANNTATINYV